MRFRFLSALALSLTLFSFSSRAEEIMNPPSFTLEDVAKRVEKRRGTWISLKAETEVLFITAENQTASCQGTLLYNRLDEALRLDCFNDKAILIFTFKTLDRDFELYLPARKSLYQGDIFSLEDSPAIESHLRALDLYRALKPMLIQEENTSLDQAEDGLISIQTNRPDDTPFRQLTVSNQGDILSETYYAMDGNPSVEIKREDFQKIVPAPASETETVFPRNILISSKKTNGASGSHTTEFHFKKVDFSAEIKESDFQLVLPEDIRTIALAANTEDL